MIRVRFSPSGVQENPSDKDVNQGTLVVFNLDASVTNEELRNRFGVYGEIKEVRKLGSSQGRPNHIPNHTPSPA